MILPRFSYLLAGLSGRDVKIYPDSAHGSCSSTMLSLLLT